LPSSRIVGAFVFPEFWRDPARFTSGISTLRDFGVNAIMTESDSYEHFAVDAVHQAGLRFYAGVACFSDHASDFRWLEEHPESWPILETGEPRPQMEWYVGIPPSDRRRQAHVAAEIARIARTYAIDGLFLDFMRWPLHWEIELRPCRPRPLDSSFDVETLMRFEKATGSLPPGLDTASARAIWIRENRSSAWVDFKCKIVTDFVGMTRKTLKDAKPDAELGIYVVPNLNGLAEPLTGQRIRDLAPLVDWVAPMLYHNILLQPPSWIGTALTDVAQTAGGKTLAVVQADSNRDTAPAADWGPPMSDSDWRITLAEVASRSDVGGLIVFPGTALITARGESLRTMVKVRR
jgi:hypothetical protein